MTHRLIKDHPEFRNIARRFQVPLLLATGLLSVASLLALGIPLDLKNMVEGYVVDDSYLKWALTGAAMLGVMLVMQALGRLRTTSISERLKARMRLHLYEKLLGRHMAFHREHGPGDLISAMYTDLDQFSALYTALVPSGVASGLILVGALAALVRLDPGLAGLLFAAAAIVFVLMRLLFRKFRQMGRELHEQLGGIYRAINETLRQVMVIKSLRLTGWASDRLKQQLADIIDLNVRLQFYYGLLSLVVQVLLVAALLAGWVVLSQSAAIEGLGTQLSALLYGLLLVRQVGNVAGLVAQYRRAQGAMDRLANLLGDGSRAPGGRDPHIGTLRQLDIRNLNFKYDERFVLDRVSVTFDAGDRVAIVGANGAGKTTLINLLAGLEEPPAGAIFWNGADLRGLDVDTLRQHIAYMPQDSLLSQATIADNLRMGRLDAGDDELWAAAERAGVAGTIRRLDAGMDYLLGSEGSRLSGGEQRRLALARLLLRTDADLYLLDEPTEGLDPESENDILTTALEALAGKTVLLVTHRPAVLGHVDRVLRMSEGRLTEGG
jgi:ABC-type multidrug transport system fused ATPase/permease subunit